MPVKIKQDPARLCCIYDIPYIVIYAVLCMVHIHIIRVLHAYTYTHIVTRMRRRMSVFMQIDWVWCGVITHDLKLIVALTVTTNGCCYSDSWWPNSGL